MTAETTFRRDSKKASFLALSYPYDDVDGVTCLVQIRYLDPWNCKALERPESIGAHV
jgi:hypothetical protein